MPMLSSAGVCFFKILLQCSIRVSTSLNPDQAGQNVKNYQQMTKVVFSRLNS